MILTKLSIFCLADCLSLHGYLFNSCSHLVKTFCFFMKQVASFLYHQENMTVLVEPEVHDIFARIPGFGFVQTFYSQDTRYLKSFVLNCKMLSAF